VHGEQGKSTIHRSFEFSFNIWQPKAAPAAKAGSPSTPAPSGTASTPAPPAAPQPNPPSAPAAQPSTPTPAQTTTAAAEPVASGFNDPSAFLVGNRNESTVREMEAMGFARPEIDRALRAAYFNPDRAIEYLLSGIPENIQAEQRERQQQHQQQQQTAQAGAQATPASPPPAQAAQPAGDEPINLFEAAAQAGQQGRGGGAARGGGLGAAAGGNAQQNMDFLRQSPHFQQLRQLVQQQPAMLEPILQQVAEGNPQLAQIIGQNQEQFLQLLAEVSQFH
jgi:UV excision repair protein RAD23